MKMGWIYLAVAIVLEVAGTISMKYSGGFSKLLPSILMFLFYGISFTSLNLSLNYMKVSTVYATWSGIGIVLISAAGVFIFQEKLNLTTLIWIVVIIVGVIGLNMSSSAH